MLIDDTAHNNAQNTTYNTENNIVTKTPAVVVDQSAVHSILDTLPSKLAFLLGCVVTTGSIGFVGIVVIVWRLLSVA